jgi:NADP-dependent 3-hydroxy acid dehydrogenase YdfG
MGVKMSEIQNKVVIITGASSGLGAATAERLAASGAKLIVAARREERIIDHYQFPIAPATLL